MRHHLLARISHLIPAARSSSVFQCGLARFRILNLRPRTPANSIGRKTHLKNHARRFTTISGQEFEPKRTQWRGWTAVILMLVMAWMPACHAPEESQPEKVPQGYENTVDRGPISVTLKLDRKHMSIADHVTLSLEVALDEDYDFEFPAFGDKLEQFGIVDYHTSDPQLGEDQRVRTTRTYELEPFLSGEYKIPPMTLTFWEKQSRESTHEIQTEEVTVEVNSLLPEEFENLELHDIRPPVTLPSAGVDKAIVAAIIMALVGMIWLAWWFVRRGSQQDRSAPSIPPHEMAFAQLEALIARNLVEKGEIKTFYQEISAILRRYIEMRFGLNAPESTTEEFLSDLERTSVLDASFRPLLSEFLRHCDLVKFAEHQPSHEDIQGAFDSCKTFILETQDTESGVSSKAPAS